MYCRDMRPSESTRIDCGLASQLPPKSEVQRSVAHRLNRCCQSLGHKIYMREFITVRTDQVRSRITEAAAVTYEFEIE